jgi:undecaprenyl-diphosphatase
MRIAPVCAVAPARYCQKFIAMTQHSKQPPAVAVHLIHARRAERTGMARQRAQRRLGMVIFLLATAAFLAVACQVWRQGPVTLFDAELARWFQAHASPGLTEALLDISRMHAPAGIAVLAAGMATYMALKHERYWLLAVLLTIPPGMALNALLKLGFQRPRPLLDHSLEALATYSFPSGHAAYSTMLYGLLAAYVAHRVDRRRWRLASLLACAAVVALVAFSRLYLSAHYLSDVLAGIFEGIAWLALVWIAVTRLRWRRRPDAAY